MCSIQCFIYIYYIYIVLYIFIYILFVTIKMFLVSNRYLLCFQFYVNSENNYKPSVCKFQLTSYILLPQIISSHLIKTEIELFLFFFFCLKAVDITSCGNFAIIGLSSGTVDVYNMQSGIHRGSFGDDKGIGSFSSFKNKIQRVSTTL